MKYLKFFPFLILSIIPLPVLYVFSDFMYILVYHLVKYRRPVVRTNLLNSFPHKSLIEITTIEKKFYKHFCDTAFESIKALTLSKKAINERFIIKNTTLIETLHKENMSVILYTSHYGNWEWFSFLPLFFPHQVQAFYQEVSNSYFNDFMLVLRSRFGVQCIESKQGYKTMVNMQQKRILTATCMIGDQSPREKSSKHWMNFLHQETAFLVGADRIAEKLKQTILYVSVKKPTRGNYEIEFIPLEEGKSQNKDNGLITNYATLLEQSIMEKPELWLWSHKRWKLNPLENK